MIQASKIIGTGLATTGLIGIGAGIGVPELQVYSRLLITFLLLYISYCFLTAANRRFILFFPVCILSNQSNLVSLNPNFVTGFSDGLFFYRI
jgi:hypothetical protein